MFVLEFTGMVSKVSARYDGTILALSSLRQEACQKFKDSLEYLNKLKVILHYRMRLYLQNRNKQTNKKTVSESTFASLWNKMSSNVLLQPRSAIFLRRYLNQLKGFSETIVLSLVWLFLFLEFSMNNVNKIKLKKAVVRSHSYFQITCSFKELLWNFIESAFLSSLSNIENPHF